MTNFSIVIPALNEEKNIKKLIPIIYEFVETSIHNFEVILIIGPDEQISIKKKYENLHIINRQKILFSSALICGITHAKNNYLITMDADCSHSFSEIISRVDYFVQNNLDILIFSRHLSDSQNYENIINIIFSKLLNSFLRFNSKLKLTDYSNNLRIFKKSIMSNEPFISKHFEFLYEFLIKAKHNLPDLKIVEVPATHLKRSHGRSKKNHIRYLLRYIFLIIRLRFRKL